MTITNTNPNTITDTNTNGIDTDLWIIFWQKKEKLEFFTLFNGHTAPMTVTNTNTSNNNNNNNNDTIIAKQSKKIL